MLISLFAEICFLDSVIYELLSQNTVVDWNLMYEILKYFIFIFQNDRHTKILSNFEVF